MEKGGRRKGWRREEIMLIEKLYNYENRRMGDEGFQG